MKKFMAVMLSACMAFSLCACGNTATERNSDATAEKSTKNSKKITMVLDWTPNTNHTGIYVAQEKGYFKEAGLDVSLIRPPDNGATELVASGEAEFGMDFLYILAAAFSSVRPLPPRPGRPSPLRRIPSRQQRARTCCTPMCGCPWVSRWRCGLSASTTLPPTRSTSS